MASLDFPTIAVIGLLLHIGLAVGFSLILLVLRSQPVPRLWAASLWAGAVSTVLVSVPLPLPEPVGILVRNAFAVLGSILLLSGVALHVGRRAPVRPASALAVAYLLAIAWFAIARPDLGIRLALYSVLIIIWKIWEAWLLLRHAPADVRRSCRLAATVFLLDAALFLVRALLPVAPVAGGDILRAGLPMSVTYIGGMFVMLGHTFALVLLIVERQMVDLRRLARRDGLTGLLNRTALLGDGGQQLEQCVRLQQPFAAMLLDLDHFKRINDTRGHQAGDEVLHHTARTLQRNLRGRDWLLGRYGGEEFVLLLPGVGMEQALALAERLRAALEASPLDRDGGAIVITTSIGVAIADATPDLERLLAHADAALYRAKAAGRNRVACDLAVEPGPVA
ncbi:diguanylate cyclase [Stenotrophomonas sp. MYb238]|uniref:GGDEF domain-containing protein n=1 Tax=Stenotrophomonas sp. MYb238 TaxID=2040281 RepID=UPI001291CEEC|nr:GGDEF domain-containing protein [Stenotrophomonas sp. MYb238]MQP76150.1 diguanylate cyclase [Stenotrophomonas sp. MYb238]